MQSLQGQIAIVTGGAGGIGSAIVSRLAADGARVAVADIADQPDGSPDVGSRSEDPTFRVDVDVTDADSIRRMTDEVIERHGRIDILVNNAGFTRDAPIAEMDDEAWDAVVKVCLYGTFACSRAVVPSMVRQEYGRIVNMASRAYLGNPGQSNYAAAKSGIVGLTKSLSKELGRHSITVNAIAPGLIRTDAVTSHPRWELIEELALRSNSIKRLGEPDDVAAAVRYLASPEASFVSGDVVHVSGGRFS